MDDPVKQLDTHSNDWKKHEDLSVGEDRFDRWLVLPEEPAPKPGAGEVLVRIKAASLNFRA